MNPTETQKRSFLQKLIDWGEKTTVIETRETRVSSNIIEPPETVNIQGKALEYVVRKVSQSGNSLSTTYPLDWLKKLSNERIKEKVKNGFIVAHLIEFETGEFCILISKTNGKKVQP